MGVPSGALGAPVTTPPPPFGGYAASQSTIDLVEEGAPEAAEGLEAAEAAEAAEEAVLVLEGGGELFLGLSAGVLLGIGLVVVGVVLLGIYLYSRSKSVPSKASNPQKCPTPRPPQPVPNPAPSRKKVPDRDLEHIPETEREAARKRIQDKRDRNDKCMELWESIRDMSVRSRTSRGADTAGLEFRFYDQLCSSENPNDSNNAKDENGKTKWDRHEDAYEAQRRGLAKKIQEFQESCDGELPDDAEKWSQTKSPGKSEWQGDKAWCIQYRNDRKAVLDGPPNS